MNDRFRFRVWDKENKCLHYPTRYNNFSIVNGTVVKIESYPTANSAYLGKRIAYEFDDAVIMQCTGLKDKNGNLIFAGDIVTYYHNKKKLVPVTDRKPFEAPYGNDEETGLPLQYRTVKVIRYKGYVSIDAIGGMELNLRHNLHWWKSLEKDILTQVEVIGNIYENKELLESEG